MNEHSSEDIPLVPNKPEERERPRQDGPVIVLIHGIRTYGEWQVRLSLMIAEKCPTATVLVYRYGYFNALAFLIPFLQTVVARQFKRWLESCAQEFAGRRVCIMAHSFGTFVAARAIAGKPLPFPVETLLVCGSVLRPRFPFGELIRSARLGRVVNDVGRRDIWPLMAQMLVLRMGNAGRVGFQGAVGPHAGIINRWYPDHGHSDFFSDKHLDNESVPMLLGLPVPPGRMKPYSPSLLNRIESVLEPLKLLSLLLPFLLVCGPFIAKLRHDWLVSEARALVGREPAESVLLSLRAQRWWPFSSTAAGVRHAAIRQMEIEARRDAGWQSDWTQAGLLSGVHRKANSLGYRHPERDIWISSFSSGGGSSDASKSSEDTPAPPAAARPKSESPANRVLLLNGEMGRARILDLPKRRPATGNNSPVTAINFSPTGQHVVAGYYDVACVYDLSGDIVAEGPGAVSKEQWAFLNLVAQDSILLGSRRAVGGSGGEIKLFAINRETRSLDPLLNQRLKGAPVFRIVRSPDEAVLVTLQVNRDFSVWRFTPPGKELAALKQIAEIAEPPVKGDGEFQFDFGPKMGRALDAAIHPVPGGHLLAVAFEGSAPLLWTIRAQAVEARPTPLVIDSATQVLRLKLGDRGRALVCLTKNNELLVIDLASGKIRHSESFVPMEPDSPPK